MRSVNIYIVLCLGFICVSWSLYLTITISTQTVIPQELHLVKREVKLPEIRINNDDDDIPEPSQEEIQIATETVEPLAPSEAPGTQHLRYCSYYYYYYYYNNNYNYYIVSLWCS